MYKNKSRNKKKKKNNKKKINKNTITLDRKHIQLINHFKNNRIFILKEKKTILDELKNKYNKIKNISKKNCDDNILNQQFILKEKIKNVEDEINDINNDKDIKKYYLQTMELLTFYYQKKNDNEDIDCCNKDDKLEKKKSGINKTVIDFFNMKKNNDNNMKKYFTTHQKFNRSTILDEYLSKIGSDNIDKYEINENDAYCQKCNVEKILVQSEALYVCVSCGKATPAVIDSDKPSYKEPPSEISYFAYKRINHFNEWLSQFQAKESTNIPDEVYHRILCEIKKERITNMSKLDHIKLRQILKRLNLNKYYEHIHHIINKLNGLPPPVLSRKLEERMRIMFKDIQKPFSKCCPKYRKNFLSYAYVIRKFLQLLCEDKYIPYFPLLKSREKLYQQDCIWKCITKKLNWEFIPSI